MYSISFSGGGEGGWRNPTSTYRPIFAIPKPNLEPNNEFIVIGCQSQGSGGMRDYRAYILGIDGHRFVRVKDFLSDQPDDTAALSAAKRLVDGHEIELWDAGRLVARLSLNGEVVSPELAPLMVPAAPTASETNSIKKSPGNSLSLSRVSELAGASSEDNHLLLGW